MENGPRHGEHTARNLRTRTSILDIVARDPEMLALWLGVDSLSGCSRRPSPSAVEVSSAPFRGGLRFSMFS